MKYIPFLPSNKRDSLFAAVWCLLFTLLTAAMPCLSQERNKSPLIAKDKTHKWERKNKLVAFVGKKVFVEPVLGEEMSFDAHFKAKYIVLQNIYGRYEKDTIEFDSYDHYGRAPYADFAHVLLYVNKYKRKFYHEKYIFAPVYKTTDGRWAGVYDPYDYHSFDSAGRPVEPEKIAFEKRVAFPVFYQNDSGKTEKRAFDERYYTIEGDSVIATHGNYVEDLFRLAKEGILTARNLFGDGPSMEEELAAIQQQVVLEPLATTPHENGSAEELAIEQSRRRFQYIAKSVPGINIPQRKFDSPFFCNELLPFKNGFIVNSITSHWGSKQVAVKTSFYYYDAVAKIITKLGIAGADTIESVVVGKGNALFSSIVQHGKRVLLMMNEGKSQSISEQAPAGIRDALDTAKWIKLGVEDGRLYVLSPTAVYMMEEKSWTQLTTYSLDNYYVDTLKYRYSISSLPTRNITIHNNQILFLQEMVQERACRLFRLQLQTGVLTDFFQGLQYTDDYEKVINDYSILPDSSLLVSSSRLMGQSLVLQLLQNNVKTWIFNNRAYSTSGDTIEVSASTAAMKGDTIYLAGEAGIFKQYNDTLEPVVHFSNIHQTIRQKRDQLDFEFVPRSMIVLRNNIFLIGGMWGGLYIVDPSNGSVVCLDDIAIKKVKEQNWLTL